MKVGTRLRTPLSAPRFSTKKAQIVTTIKLRRPLPKRQILSREIVEELIGHKGKTWDEKTQRQHRAVSKMLGAIAGSDDLGEIKHAHCVAYIQNLSNLPKSYGKSQRDAELSIADLLERGQRLRASGQAEKVGLSPATVNRHITQLSTILKYCRANQRPIGEVELLRDFRLIDPQRDGDKRPAFEVEDVERLFAHPVWTSTTSEVDMRQIASRQQIFAAVYWLPLLGYYTCARLSELTYLEIDDVDVTRGTLRIRPTADGVSRMRCHSELCRSIPNLFGSASSILCRDGRKNERT